MNAPVVVAIELPATLQKLHLPPGLQQRLQSLLDKQDAGTPLSPEEREEAEGLVDVAELFSLLRLQSQPRRQEGTAQS